MSTWKINRSYQDNLDWMAQTKTWKVERDGVEKTVVTSKHEGEDRVGEKIAKGDFQDD